MTVIMLLTLVATVASVRLAEARRQGRSLLPVAERWYPVLYRVGEGKHRAGNALLVSFSREVVGKLEQGGYAVNLKRGTIVHRATGRTATIADRPHWELLHGIMPIAGLKVTDLDLATGKASFAPLKNFYQWTEGEPGEPWRIPAHVGRGAGNARPTTPAEGAALRSLKAELRQVKTECAHRPLLAIVAEKPLRAGAAPLDQQTLAGLSTASQARLAELRAAKPEGSADVQCYQAALATAELARRAPAGAMAQVWIYGNLNEGAWRYHTAYLTLTDRGWRVLDSKHDPAINTIAGFVRRHTEDATSPQVVVVTNPIQNGPKQATVVPHDIQGGYAQMLRDLGISKGSGN